MSWLGAIGSAFSFLGGESVSASLVRAAIGIGLMRYLNKSSSNADQNKGGSTTPAGVRQQISPATDNKIPVVYGKAYLGGTIIDVRLMNDNKELYAVLAITEKTGDIFSTNPSTPASRTMSNIVIDDIYINNSKITFKADGTTVDYITDESGVVDRNPSGIMGIYLYKGSSNDPMLPCQTGTTTPITGTVPSVAYEVMPGWTESHTCQNVIFAIVKLNYDPSKGYTTIPNLKFHVVNDLTKPGDVLHDYATNVMYGAGLDEAMIDPAGITALNNYSDELVTYDPYPAQARYRINGVIRTSENVMANMDRIVSAAGSYITYDISTGKWSTVINRVTAKTKDFDDSNIIGQIAIGGTALDTFYNSIEVQFPYDYLKDQQNFVRIDLPENLRHLNEPDNMVQINQELVNNIVQASILGNLELRQSREDISVTFTTDYSSYNLQIGDVFGLTSDVYGWTDQLFRVIRIKKNESDDGQLTLEITGLSYNEDVYTVEPITDFVPTIGAGSSLPNLGAIATPIAPTVTSTTGASSQPNIVITGTVPEGVVTEMEFWYAKSDAPTVYKLLGSMRPENGGTFNIGGTTSFKTILLSSGTYYFKVRALNASGSSEYSPASTALAYTYTQAPDVLPYNVPAVDENGNSISQGSQALNLGMLAFYVASKLNWGGILEESSEWLQETFGISPEAIASVQSAIATETPITIKDEGTTITTSVKSLTFTGKGIAATDYGLGNGNVSIIVNGLTTYFNGAPRTTGTKSIDFKGNVYVTHDGNDNLSVEVLSGGGGGAVLVQDEGSTVVSAASVMNFVGQGVTATATGTNSVNVSIPCCGGGSYPVGEGGWYCTTAPNHLLGIVPGTVVLPAPPNSCDVQYILVNEETGAIGSYPKVYMPSLASGDFTSGHYTDRIGFRLGSEMGSAININGPATIPASIDPGWAPYLSIESAGGINYVVVTSSDITTLKNGSNYVLQNLGLFFTNDTTYWPENPTAGRVEVYALQKQTSTGIWHYLKSNEPAGWTVMFV